VKFFSILLEGKKERTIDRFRVQLEPMGEDAVSHAEKLIDNDPSPTKKYSEWGIKKFITIGKNVASLNHTIENIIEVIKNYHSIVDRLSKEKAQKMMDEDESETIFYSEDSKNKVLRNPKDINSFETVYELQKFLNFYDNFQFLLDQKEQSKKESEKIFEDDRFLIVRPLSHTSSCYYGATTKWCTTERNSDMYFNKFASRGKLYYIIDKKSSNRTYGKMALFIPNGKGTPEIYNQEDRPETMNFLLNRFEPIKDEISNLTKLVDDYETLRKVKSNPKNSIYEALNSKFFDHFNGENAVFYFSNDLKDFLNFMEDEIGEDSIGHYMWAYENPNSDFFYDYYRFDDDMREGYPLYSLNEEHIGLLRSIVEIMEPKLLNYFDGDTIIRDGDGDIVLARFIKEKLPKLYEDFGYLYSNAEDTSTHEGVKKYIEDEICNLYEEIGLKKSENEPCFGQYTISVDRLIDLYEDNLDYNKKLSVEQVLENVIQQNIDLDHYLLDSMNEYQDNDIFEEIFNDDMTSLLENVLDDLEMDDEVVTDANEYRRILKYIKDKFGLDKPYPIKTSDEGIEIVFKGVNPKTSKINFELVNPDGDKKEGSAKLSTIIKLLNNYTLFHPF